MKLNYYSTSNLGLAAYLMYRGFQCTLVEKEANSIQKNFVFKRKQHILIEKEAELYYSNMATVDPLRYNNIHATCKCMLHDYHKNLTDGLQ